MKQSVVEVQQYFRISGMVAVGAMLFGGCVGSVNGPGGDDSDDNGSSKPPPPVVDDNGNVIGVKPTFSCDNGAVPASVGLRKLTTTQYRNTLRDLIGVAFNGDNTEAMGVWSALSAGLAKYPTEERERVPQDLHGSYRQLDQDLQQAHVDVGYEIAAAAASKMVEGARLGKLVGGCATDSNTGNDAACIDDFIKGFGERALRRPLETDEVAFYRGFYGTSNAIDPLAFTDLIAGFLTAPQFLYMVEHGDRAIPNKADLFGLSNFELASRLSYHFTQSMPDADLWAAAKAGTLTSEGEYEKQVDRLMDDPRARKASQEFFTDYLKVEDLPALEAANDKKDFKALAGDLAVTNMLRQNMIDDAVEMFQYYTWEKGGSVDDVLKSELSFARTSDLAKVYNVEPWDGQSDPPALPGGERPGFLTRAAFLSTDQATTRPIMKGVFIRTSVLCDEIPPPPPGASNAPVDTTNGTTREAVEAITEQASSACAGCHQTLINGLGFATENYDALGRHRSEEVLFSDEGKERLRLEVNTRAIPRVFEDDEREVSGPGELMARIAESGKVQACMARNYFRFTFARWEDAEGADNCALERLRKTVDGGGGLKDMLRTVALSTEFKSRKFAQ